MSSENEEDDYMSDKYLLADVRPSLISDPRKKRQIEMDQEEDMKRQKLSRSGTITNEMLQENLKRPIASENKGFQLLAKMGYKPGQSLGKETTNAANVGSTKPLIEPIGISIKTNRGGLGREAALRELTEKRQQLKEERLKRLAGGGIAEFRLRKMQDAEERYLRTALRHCQKTCENLDIECNIEVPELPCFWPERETEPTDDDIDETNKEQETNEDDAELEDYSNAEKVSMLTGYLRTSYYFCFWCGVRYVDEEDLNSNCPGLTRDEH